MQSDHDQTSYCQDLVRQSNNDRYLTGLLAPEPVRDHLWALYAFDAEIAGVRAKVSEAAIVRDAFARVADVVRTAPVRLAHRDFQSANLHVTARRGAARLVMIDLQGALMAPPEYDLVCLLRDSYVELDDDAVSAHLARVRCALPDPPDPSTFRHRFDLLTLARKGKDHALFLYAAAELGDRRYLPYLPVTRRYLQTAAATICSSVII